MSHRDDNVHALCAYLALAQRWCTANELALHLHISTRTVRTYVRLANERASDGACILSSAIGYRWNEAKSSGAYWLASNPEPRTPEERALYYIRLMLYRGPLDLYDAADELSISDYTVQSDLPQLRAIAASFGLSIATHKTSLSIEGDEAAKRLLGTECIKRTCKVELLTQAYIRRAFPAYDTEALLDCVLRALDAEGIAIDGFARYELLLRIAVQATRIEQGHVMARPQRLSKAAVAERHASRRLSRSIGRMLDITYPEPEEAYLAMLIFSIAVRTACDTSDTAPDRERARAGARRALAFLAAHLTITVPLEQLAEEVADWYLRARCRSDHGIVFENPIARRLRTTHPVAYDMSAWAMIEIQESLGALEHPEVETDWLAFTIASRVSTEPASDMRVTARLICPLSPKRTEELAESLGRRVGGRMSIVDTITTTDIDDDPFPVELTLSIVPTKRSTRTLVISPFPTERDYTALENACEDLFQHRRRHLLATYFSCYLDQGAFMRADGALTREQALGMLCARLEEAGAVERRFEGVLGARELIDGTAFSNIVAIPHACSSSVRRNAIAALVSKRPIPWGASKVNLVVVIAIERELLDDFYAIYEMCISQLSVPRTVAALMKARDAQAWVDAIARRV